MIKVNITYIFFTFLLCPLVLKGQYVEGQSYFSTCGSTRTIGQIEIISNLGELMTDNFFSTSEILTQGFIQPLVSSTVPVLESNAEFDCIVYPNPTFDFLNISIAQADASEIVIEICDIVGKKIISKQIFEPSIRPIITQFNLTTLSNGIYIVNVYDNQNKFHKSIKLIKS